MDAQYRQPGVTAKRLATHLAVSVPASAAVFGVLGPLMGTAILLAPILVTPLDASAAFLFNSLFGFGISSLAAMTAGALVAAASPFVGSNRLFRLTAAAAGGLAMLVWGLLTTGEFGGSSLLFALIGAVSAGVCTQIVWDWPLHRKSGLERRAAQAAFGA
jgi:hypothetical protein